MAPPLSQYEPSIAIAGDTWEWTRTFADFPVSEGYALSYGFVSLTGAQPPLAWNPAWVTNDGRQFIVAIPGDTTQQFDAGAYAWQAFLTLAGKRHTSASGVTIVASDFATSQAGGEFRHAAEQLVAVRKEIKGRIDGTGSGVESYQLGPRLLAFIPFKELVDYEAQLSLKVIRLANPDSFGRDIRHRYRRASSGGRR